MSCRTGCRTKDHASYAECLRAARVTVDSVINSSMQLMYEDTKKDLRAYEAAKANGLVPAGTTRTKVKEAEAASRLLKRPYDASAGDPPPSMITSKTAAKFVNWKE